MNHNHRRLIKLMTWNTALSNSMKLWAIPCRATKTDGSWWRVLTKRVPLEKGMANHFSILVLRTPWTVWKGKKNMTVKDKLPRLVDAPYATGERTDSLEKTLMLGKIEGRRRWGWQRMRWLDGITNSMANKHIRPILPFQMLIVEKNSLKTAN